MSMFSYMYYVQFLLRCTKVLFVLRCTKVTFSSKVCTQYIVFPHSTKYNPDAAKQLIKKLRAVVALLHNYTSESTDVC